MIEINDRDNEIWAKNIVIVGHDRRFGHHKIIFDFRLSIGDFKSKIEIRNSKIGPNEDQSLIVIIGGEQQKKPTTTIQVPVYEYEETNVTQLGKARLRVT